MLVGPLAAACSSPDGRQSTPNSQGPAGPPQAENLVGETIVPAIAG